MTTFNYSTGDPANLTSGTAANMADIKGPFTDLATFLNGANLTDTNVTAAGLTLSRLLPLILYGTVNGSTGAIFNAGSGGWTSAKVGTGSYTLAFSPTFGGAPIIVASANTAGAAEVAVVATIAAGSAAITTNLTTSAAGTDANFTFFAIGVR